MADAPARTELKVTTGPIRGRAHDFTEGRGDVPSAKSARATRPDYLQPPT